MTVSHQKPSSHDSGEKRVAGQTCALGVRSHGAHIRLGQSESNQSGSGARQVRNEPFSNRKVQLIRRTIIPDAVIMLMPQILSGRRRCTTVHLIVHQCGAIAKCDTGRVLSVSVWYECTRTQCFCLYVNCLHCHRRLEGFQLITLRAQLRACCLSEHNCRLRKSVASHGGRCDDTEPSSSQLRRHHNHIASSYTTRSTTTTTTLACQSKNLLDGGGPGRDGVQGF